MRKEEQFMKEYFPEWANLLHCCDSWMLSPYLEDILPENSSIRWFRSIFDFKKYIPEEIYYLEFVFKMEYFQYTQKPDYHTLREDTSLQRGLKKLLLQGVKPGSGLGYLNKEKLFSQS